jgi:RNA polymerase sigma factor (sigma-70 family)
MRFLARAMRFLARGMRFLVRFVRVPDEFAQRPRGAADGEGMSANVPTSKIHVLLESPAVAKTIRAFVARRVPASDAPDVAQRVCLRLLRCSTLPDDARRLAALVAVVTRRAVVDYYRYRAIRQRCEELLDDFDLVPANDDFAPLLEAFDARERLDWVRAQVDAGRIDPRLIELAQAIAHGDSLEEIAARQGKSVASVKMMLSRTRKALRAMWSRQLGAPS